MPNEYLPKPGKKFKDMDRRPVPMHIDDMVEDDAPDEKWVPGNRRKTAKPKDPQKEQDGSKKNATEIVASSFDIVHFILIAVISFAAIAGIVFLAGAVAQVYGIDLWGQMRSLLDPLIGPSETLPTPVETENP